MSPDGALAGRVAVIGDVGGHRQELGAQLSDLGVPQRGWGPLPEDLTVIQVGDLVHRGPDSAGVVVLVDTHLRRQPGRWIQLVGNHEAQYLRTPAFQWSERLAREEADLLRSWWSDGSMRVAATVSSGGEDFLVTHAGLTRGFWSDVLGAPDAVGTAATALNDLALSDDDRVYTPGQLLRGRRPHLGAGPLWASAATELVPSWVGHRLPFSQVHGHTSLLDVDPDAVTAPVVRDVAARHACAVLDGGRILGIDPDHGRAPRSSWRPWVVRGSVG